MKMATLLLVLFSSLLGRVAFADDVATSTFDNGLDGWTLDPAGGDSWRSSGGNPGGFFHFDDLPGVGSSWMVAPARFLGDWSSLDEAGLIAFDHKLFEYSAGCELTRYKVELRGQDDNGQRNSARWTGDIIEDDRLWHTVCVRIIEQDWNVTAGSWDGLLSSVDEFRIDIELVNNSGPCDNVEREGMDNIRLCRCDASWSNYGAGLAGTHGVPSLTVDRDPILGTEITLLAENSLGSATSGLLLGGLASANDPIGGCGGVLLVAPPFAITILVSIDASGLRLPYTVPCDPNLCALDVFLQLFEQDSGACGGISMTPGLMLTFGM